MRPETNNSPPLRNPRSPVRRYGPWPSRVLATKVSTVAAGLFQYPWATEGEDTQISPSWPSGIGTSVLGSTILTSASGSGEPQETKVPSTSADAGEALLGVARPEWRPEIKRVASAIP